MAGGENHRLKLQGEKAEQRPVQWTIMVTKEVSSHDDALKHGSDESGHARMGKVPIKLRVLGKCVTTMMEPAQAALIQQAQANWDVRTKQRIQAAKEAIARLRASNQDHKEMATNLAMDAVCGCMSDASSEERLPLLLRLVGSGPAPLFWRVFLKTWPSCDDTWRLQEKLLRTLKRHNHSGISVQFFSEAQRRLLNELPSLITAYRGCSLERVLGLSWTLDPSAAAGFAAGHRGIGVPNPVVALAKVPKDQVFALFIDRNEAELLVDPSSLLEFVIAPAGADD